MKVKIISLIIIAVLLVLSVPAYAVDENRTTTSEHIFTAAELACDAPVDPSVLSSASEDGFVPVNLIEEYMARATTEYYIAKTSDGNMLSSSATNTLRQARYLSGVGNSYAYLKWRFSLESDGNYIVYAYNDASVCLTVDPSTRNVTLSEDEGTQYQKWKIYYSSGGNVLQCMATDSRVSGYKLYFDASNFYVSNTNYSVMGFITASSFVPCRSMTADSICLMLGDNQYLNNIQYNPSNSNYRDGVWVSYYISNTSVCTISSSAYLSTVSTGHATVTVTNKITSAFDTFDVDVVSSIATYNIKLYYGQPALTSYTQSEIVSIYEDAFAAFYDVFYMQMNISSVTKIDDLNVTCGNTQPNQICNTVCGANNMCHTKHHKSATQLAQVEYSNTEYTSRFVTHAICWYDTDDQEHNGVLGLGAKGGKNNIVTTNANDHIERTIQHELTHNIGGVGDNECTPYQDCVMKDTRDSWCDHCRNAVIQNRS